MARLFGQSPRPDGDSVRRFTTHIRIASIGISGGAMDIAEELWRTAKQLIELIHALGKPDPGAQSNWCGGDSFHWNRITFLDQWEVRTGEAGCRHFKLSSIGKPAEILLPPETHCNAPTAIVLRRYQRLRLVTFARPSPTLHGRCDRHASSSSEHLLRGGCLRRMCRAYHTTVRGCFVAFPAEATCCDSMVNRPKSCSDARLGLGFRAKARFLPGRTPGFRSESRLT